ncbi:MAG TPA: biotin--[acetyl-CoA-carboxylase] ligase [Candidatus Acidoferrales bacterium]|nr:biotin--[acetyl-CoA-carboxylase] ligase [Candidatus Acidoferrales bacterium]
MIEGIGVQPALKGSHPVDELAITQNLKTRYLGRKIAVTSECTSTNDVVKCSAGKGAPHGFVSISETQSAGRGRLGRLWVSPAGGIWLSILLRPRTHQFFLDSLPLLGALAIAGAVNSQLRLKARVRWPNDVVVDDRKIAGVLAEAKSTGNELAYTILGLGINANFKIDEIGASTNVATLQALQGAPIDRVALICRVLLEVENLYELLCAGMVEKLVSLVRKLECSRGRSVRVKLENRELLGMFDDYETLGRVRILTRQGTQPIDTSTLLSVEYQSN